MIGRHSAASTRQISIKLTVHVAHTAANASRKFRAPPPYLRSRRHAKLLFTAPGAIFATKVPQITKLSFTTASSRGRSELSRVFGYDGR